MSAKLGYLTSQYPATSHTFISREVAALRRLGVQIDTFSIRAPSGEELQDPRIAEECMSTFTILRQPLSGIATAHLSALFRRPISYFATLRLACGHRVPGLKGFLLGIAYFAEAIVLAREIQRREITRLHNHFANSAATVGFLAAKLAGVPWSFTMHGISETDYPAGLLLGRKIAMADFVACVSYFGRAQAMRVVSPHQWHKLKIVRSGLSMAELPATADRQVVSRIICVGRLSSEKGQAGLLEAFSTLALENPQLTLSFVGDGPERGTLQAHARALGIEHQVTFEGRCSEKETLQHIADADLLVLPSFMEGLPIVLMEAMAIGTPVIASRVAGIPEIIDEGRTGLLFTPSDWPALLDCLRRVIEDWALRMRLAEAARTSVRSEFKIDQSAKMMVELFRKEPELLDG